MGNKYTERKKAQRKRKKMRNLLTPIVVNVPRLYSLGTLETVSEGAVNPTPQKKKESKMFYNYDGNSTVEGVQRNALLDDLSTTLDEHMDTLRDQFNMNENQRPRTFAALVDAIKNGMYTPPEKDLESDWKDAFSRPKWGDPSKKPDSAGFQLATQAADEEYRRVRLNLVVLPVDQALSLTEKFREWTYTTPTVH